MRPTRVVFGVVLILASLDLVATYAAVRIKRARCSKALAALDTQGIKQHCVAPPREP